MTQDSGTRLFLVRIAVIAVWTGASGADRLTGRGGQAYRRGGHIWRRPVQVRPLRATEWRKPRVERSGEPGRQPDSHTLCRRARTWASSVEPLLWSRIYRNSSRNPFCSELRTRGVSTRMPEPYDANQENEETTGANTPPLAKLRGGRGRKASTARAPLIVVADRGTLKAYKVRQTNHGLSSRVMTEKNLAGLITSSPAYRPATHSGSGSLR